MDNQNPSPPDIWQSTGIIVPAVMTLICFICTAVSLTVSGFICLRDREARDESDNRAKHHQEQEFVSKALGLFYKIRTSNVFRIKEIMQDLNEERPVWIGTKKEIISNLEYYGIFLSDAEKAKLSSNVEVFEIDCESLFYFELERFSKAQAVFGTNVLKYFECIQQDGTSFPREFYPDLKPVFHIDIIYNVFTEMQILTELFVLLATGIDLEIISVHAIPPQFIHSRLGFELSKVKDFLYNYYLRVFPKERSTATVIRLLPQLPVIYEPIVEKPQTETIETITEEILEDDTASIFGSPKDGSFKPRRSSFASLGGHETGTTQATTPIILEAPPDKPSRPGTIPPPRSVPTYSRGGRLSASLGKHKLKMVKVYKTLAERVKQKPYGQEDEEEEYMEEVAAGPSTESPSMVRQVRFEGESPQSAIKVEAPKSKKIRKKVTRKKTISDKVPEQVMTQESFYEAMRYKYKAPVRRDTTRRRGNLSTEKLMEHNAFTYMVTRVIGFLQEMGHLSSEQLNSERYNCVERNFVI